MKKIKALLMAILCVACLTFTLTACGETPPTDPTPAEKYSITFVSEDTVKGTVSAKDGSNTAINSGDEVEKGTQITLIATANTGYSFDGWYASNTKVSSQLEYTLTVNGDTSLTAKFNVNSYALSYSSSDEFKGTVTSSVQSQTVEYALSVTLTATPVAGYKLDGWYVDDHKVSTDLAYTFTMPANDYTVQARFVVESYNFGYSAESGKGTVVCLQQLGASVEFGTSISLTATANEGYTFDGWYLGNDKIPNAGTTYAFTMPSYDYVIQARFVAEKYILNYFVNDTDMGTITNAPANNTAISFGTSISLTATANEGYEFEGWFENGSLVGANLTYNKAMPARELNLEARFKPKQFNLRYTVNDQELGRIEPQVQIEDMVDFNAEIVLKAIPLSEGYQFDGWFVNGVFKNSDAILSEYMPNGSLTIEARFSVKSFILKYSVDFEERGSISCLTAPNSLVKYNEKIKLTAVEKPGYMFSGWYVDNKKLDNVGLVLEREMPASDYTVQARFVPKLYRLKFLSSDTTMGTVSAEKENKPVANNSLVNYFENVTLIATAKTGYVFKGWYKLGELVSNSNEYNITMPNEDSTYTAIFEKAKYTLSCLSEDQIKGTVSTTPTNIDKIEYNTSVTVTATEKTGYDFDGWYIEDEKIINAGATYTFTMTGDLELIAKFVAEERTVYFKDGNDTVHKETVDYNTSVNSYEYTKEGYIFKGWFTDEDIAYDFKNSKVTENITLYAKTEKDKVYYEVRFFDEDGITQIGDTQPVEEGKTLADIQNANDKTGYTFGGWVYLDTESNNYEKFDESIVVNKDLNVIAVYNPIDLKIRLYRENEKSEQNLINTIQIKYNEKPVKPDNPTKENYLFVKWVYFDNQNVEFDFNQALTKNIDLLAIWIEEPEQTVTVSFVELIDNVETVLRTEEIEKNSTVSAPNDPEKIGHTFICWAYEKSEGVYEEFDFTTVIAEELKLYAQYEINTFKVVFKDYNSTTLQVEIDGGLKNEQIVEYGGSAVAPENPTRTGYDFDCWDKAFDKVTEDLTITATYKIHNYTVVFWDIEEEKELGRYENVEYGSKISVPETPDKAGFVGWYADENLENRFDFEKTQITNPNSRTIIIYAKFEVEVINYYNVIFYDYNGQEYVEHITQSVKEGELVSDIGKLEREGYTFNYWAYEISEGEYEEFDFNTVITENLNLYAQYKINTFKVVFKDYDSTTLQVEIDGGLKNEQIVEYGGSAVAPENPTRAGYDFTGWDKTFDNVTEELTITATYEILTFNVTFMVDGEQFAEQEIEYGKAINYITATKAGHVFKYWYVSNEAIEYDKTASVAYDLILYAKFEPYEDTSVYMVEFKIDDGTGFVQYGTVQYVEKGSIATAIPGYEDQEGKTYDWCYFDESENKFKVFEFSTPITADLTLYAVEVK